MDDIALTFMRLVNVDQDTVDALDIHSEAMLAKVAISTMLAVAHAFPPVSAASLRMGVR